jgi:hypothetical protein
MYMPDSLPYSAVVTGDIVRSTRLSRERFRLVQDTIVRAGLELARHFPGKIPFPIELFRGDSWQLYLPDPVDALRMAIFVRAFVIAETARVDTRFAIGVGTIDKLPEKSVGDGRGDAFRLSGDLVDRMRASRMSIGMEVPELTNDADALATMLSVLDVVVSGWTAAQASAVCGALLGRTQEQIAETWLPKPITQQSAGQHLARAGWDGVSAVIQYYEKAMRRLSA